MDRGSWALALFAASCAAQQPPDFVQAIAPILEQQCLQCHGETAALGGLRLHTREAAMKSISPGAPDASRFYTRIELPPAKAGAMPPGGPQLPVAQRALIRQWIASGAAWPTGLTLRVAKAPAKAPDDVALVRKLNARIAANTRESKALEMKPYKAEIPGTVVSFEMLPIPAGSFVMGSPETEKSRSKDEGPQHRVTVEPFWMGKYEVTWDEYRLFMFAKQAGETPGTDAAVDAISRPTRPYVEMSFGMGINGFPAISMTQHAANKYAQWLSARTGHFYRLPTEAEWEYACRAGSESPYFFGSDPAKLGEYAVFAANSDSKYAKVGTKKPNAWGLFDMLGNVDEWTLDQYVPDWYASGGANGAVAPSKTPYPHVARGGSWNDEPDRVRCAARLGSDPSWKMQDPQLPKSIWYLTDAQWLGFRLVRPLRVPSVEEMNRAWNNGVARE